MKKWEFVITGGPCAGKTSALNNLKKVFAEKGFKVIIVPETATELMSSGIVVPEIGMEAFNNILIERSINKEETTRKALKYINKNTIIFYDRGLLDIKAYLGEKILKKILKQYKLEEASAMNRYDAVFHLVTAADGAEEFYTLLNNEARTETKEEAIELDKKIQNAWAGHKHFRIVDNSTDFKHKIDRLIKEVSSIIEN